MYNGDVISMPDKWEYPWYAAWDLAFHVIALTLVDPDFGKQQLKLMLREEFNLNGVQGTMHGVAPLMIVGMVKLAPALPVDGNFPFMHLERKFMHLGFHIYDVGFQSPNVDAARPMVFATTLLLLLIVVLLNLFAIATRNRLRRKYAGAAV
jgi:hypothetical protein